jgi:hypothetical protein
MYGVDEFKYGIFYGMYALSIEKNKKYMMTVSKKHF